MDGQLDFQATLIDSMSAPLTAIAEALQGIASTMAEVSASMSAAFDESVAASEQLQASMEGLQGSVDGLAGGMEANSGALQANTAALQENTAATEENAGAQDTAKGATDGLGKQFTALKIPMLVAGAALAGVGIAALVVGSQYESAMGVVQSLTGQTSAQMAQFNSQILAMAPAMGASPKELAQGLYYVLSAGVKTKDAMGVLKVVTEASAGSMTDAATMADALTTALNSYAAGSSQAEHYSDLLLTAVKDGKTTMQELASSIGKAAVTGSAAGISFDQVAAAMSTMTLSGDSARLASNQLAFLLRDVGINVDKVAKAAKGLHLAFDEAKFKTMDFHGKLQYLFDITRGNKEELLKLTGGAPGFQAAMMLMGDGGKAFSGILADMSRSGGLTAHAFAVHEQTMAASWDHLKAATEVAFIRIFAAIEPVAKEVTEHLAPIFQHFSDWAGTHGPQLAQIIGVVAAAIGGPLVVALVGATFAFIAANAAAIGIVLVVSAVSAGAVLLVQHWQQVTAFFQSSSPVAMGVKAAIAGLAAAVLAFGISMIPALISAGLAAIPVLGGMAVAAWAAVAPMLVAAAPFIAVGLAVAGLILLIKLLIDHWKQITAATLAFITHVGGALSAFGKHVLSILQAAWGAVVGVVRDALGLVKTIIDDDIKFIVGLFLWLYNHNYYFHDLVDTIVKVFRNLQKLVPEIWNGLVSFLKGLWDNLVKLAKMAFQIFYTVEIEPVVLLVQMIRALFGAVLSWLVGQWNQMVAVAKAAWHLFVTVISSLVSSVSTAIQSVVGAILAPITGLGQLLFNAGKNLVQMLINGIKNMAGNAANAAKDIAHNLASFLGFHSPTEQGPGADADQWMPNLMAMLAKGLLDNEGVLGDAARHAAGRLHQALGTGEPGQGVAGTSPTGAGGRGSGVLGRAGGRSGDTHIHLHIEGSMGDGMHIIDPSYRAKLAREIAVGLASNAANQGITSHGYTGNV